VSNANFYRFGALGKNSHIRALEDAGIRAYVPLPDCDRRTPGRPAGAKDSYQRTVRRANEAGLPFRAVVADAFSGKEYVVQHGLAELGLGYVLALPPSPSWWHREGQVGSLQEAAGDAGWQDEAHPGPWRKLERRFRDGHAESWWALEVEAGPYGPERGQRVVIATTDPKTLPERTT